MVYKDKYQQAREHVLWPYFVQTCEDDGFSVDPDGHVDDWFPFWEWFVAGAISEKLKQRGE